MEKTHEIWVGSPALIQEGNESKRLRICCFLTGSSSLRQLKPLVMGRKSGAVWSGMHPCHWPQVLQHCRDYPRHGAGPGLSSPAHGLGHRSPPGRWKASPRAGGALGTSGALLMLLPPKSATCRSCSKGWSSQESLCKGTFLEISSLHELTCPKPAPEVAHMSPELVLKETC